MNSVSGAVVLGLTFLVLSEFADWAPRLASGLVRWAARRLPSEHRERYEQEWIAELDMVKGKLSKLLLAGGLALSIPATRRALWGSEAPKLRDQSQGRSAKRANSTGLERIAQVASILLVGGLMIAALAVTEVTSGQVVVVLITLLILAVLLSLGYIAVRHSEAAREASAQVRRIAHDEPAMQEDDREETEEAVEGLEIQMEVALAELVQARAPKDQERAAHKAASVLAESVRSASRLAGAAGSDDANARRQTSLGEGSSLQPG